METLFIGKHWLSFKELPSTNDWLMEHTSESSMIEGTLVLAQHQTRGKGQRGAVWSAQEGHSLTCSILLLPKFLPISQAFDLSLCVALALFDCLNELRPGFSIKWPNDIYFKDKKIAGVLIENQMSKSVYQKAIVGIGLNVNQNAFEELPNAISLKQIIGVKFPVKSVVERLCEVLEARYLQLRSGKFDVLKKEYMAHLYRYNELHQYKLGGTLIQAKIVDVHRNGRLQLMFEDGSLRDFDVKEIEFCK